MKATGTPYVYVWTSAEPTIFGYSLTVSGFISSDRFLTHVIIVTINVEYLFSFTIPLLSHANYCPQEKNASRPARVFEGHSGKINCVKISMYHMFTSGSDGTVRRWNLAKYACTHARSCFFLLLSLHV